jgi:acetyl-CoA carboxylase biotin carboxyl carrier protein
VSRKPNPIVAEKKPQAIDPNLVRELATILNDTGLTEIEVEHGELRLRIARTLTMAAAPAVQAQIMHAPPPPQLTHAPAPQAPAPADPAKHPGMVPSPMVGTAYLSAEPGAAPFVKIGDTVTEGQTVLVVEAMKTFNPIPAPRAGKVTAILVTDAQPVEYGEPLLILE